MLAALRAGEPMVSFDPSGLSVRVLNGNGVSGSAGAMADRLSEDGFEIASVGDADRKDFALTTILVRPDTVAYGELIAGELGGQYPDKHSARRAAFERDKAALREIGVPIDQEIVAESYGAADFFDALTRAIARSTAASTPAGSRLRGRATLSRTLPPSNW